MPIPAIANLAQRIAGFTKYSYKLSRFFSIQSVFWHLHPALLYGLCVLLGVGYSINGSIALAAGSLLLFVSAASSPFSWKRCAGLFALFAASTVYVHTFHTIPELGVEGITGSAHFRINTLRQNHSHFGQQWLYQGVLVTFNDLQGALVGKHIPLTIAIGDKPELLRPLANGDYFVTGTLKNTRTGNYKFIPLKNDPWIRIKDSQSMAEWRYQAKKMVSNWIHEHISQKVSASFLAGIATGELDDRLLSHELARFGVQHIMAISGFHFGILATGLGLLLRTLVGRQGATLGLIAGMTFYFVFVGSNPSVARSWITICIALMASLFKKKEHALNSLGVAMLVIMIFNPLSCLHAGFQFSFLATASILLGYAPCKRLLEWILPVRTLGEALCLKPMDQYGYCLLALARNSLALTLVVHIATVPLTLFYFHKFPLLSLIYNLFFPFLVSLSMFLLMLSGLFFFFPLLADLFHKLNGYFTEFLLNFTYNMPPNIDYSLRLQPFPNEWVILYTILIISMLTTIYTVSMQHHQTESRFPF